MQSIKKHIIVIGDVMLDTFVYGRSTRKSPEADVPVLMAERTHSVAGGAANVAANIIGLGAKCSLISVTGKDNASQTLMSILEAQGCSTNTLKVSETRKTTQKTRFYHLDNMLMRLDSEDSHLLNKSEQNWVFEAFLDVLKTGSVDGLIIQDYNKGVCHPELNRLLIAHCNAINLPVFIDPKLDHYGSYNGATYIKPNIHELSEVLMEKVDSLDLRQLDKAVQKLKKHIDADNYVITMGSKGAYFSNSEENGVISTIPIELADVCGAGDTFISGFSLAITSGATLSQSLKIANTLSGYACKKRGVQPVLLKDLNKKHRSQLIWNV